MNRLHLRRAAVLTAGTLLGLAGVATVAGPAAAHHPEPSGSYCAAENGTVTVTWSVISSETDISGRITKVESTVPGAISGGLAVGAELKPAGQGPLTGTQTHTFTGALPELKLTVAARWERGRKSHDGERTVVARPGRDCATQSPSPSPSTPPSPTPTPSTPASPTPTPSASLPPSPSTPPTPSAPPAEPAEPVFKLDQDCDSMTFIVENPADGIAFTATFTTEKGESRKLVSEPGKAGSVEFEAYRGLTVTVKYDVVEESETIPYTAPRDCSGQGGGLPVTGPAAGAIAGGATLLLAAGAVLFVVARRRRIRFTA
ncbi:MULTISPECIES: cell wall anchor protein [unclassified Micromonospora]|uniref:cell wall anchor protein n=1 Tax=unclassified Micromonospora TaxID=2617518 RepID=UPI001B35ED8D|nr:MULTISPECIES: cell wall anchor protein [unclassified Micromonospora]MBQ1046734.1 cell wall anchor protein [Micromonospora sp. C72]MBQ1056058.1 cell wall anchor protein [Micromonospora sp. C32]